MQGIRSSEDHDFRRIVATAMGGVMTKLQQAPEVTLRVIYYFWMGKYFLQIASSAGMHDD